MKLSYLKLGRYDYASFATVASYAACSVAVPAILVQMADSLNFSLNSGGLGNGGALQTVRSISMTLAMVFSGFCAAKKGNRLSIAYSVIAMALGILLIAFAPTYLFVLPMLVIAGFGEGIIEGLVTPFVQDLHEKGQSNYINLTHSFWSIGIVISVVIIGWLLTIGVSWRFILAILAIISLVPALLLLLPSKTPYPEKHQGIETKQVAKNAISVLKNKPFWIFFFAIFFAGGAEYCLTFWCSSFIQLNFEGTALLGAIVTAIFALGMFIGRATSAACVSGKFLKHLLLSTGAFATLITLTIPTLATHYTSLPKEIVHPLLMTLLFLSGIGAAPFWPSIQSLTVRELPALDTTMVFIILSCAGVPGAGFFTFLMGFLGDKIGLAQSFYIVPTCFTLMAILIWLGCRATRRA